MRREHVRLGTPLGKDLRFAADPGAARPARGPPTPGPSDGDAGAAPSPYSPVTSGVVPPDRGLR
ncbi:hypothetical protein AAHZ94_10555 [Streptomyces sp. HSW2009]|uniref:hypothetical protein n=1 Tax=Streptomyces sp. HSW2009 TaxID=3142890 RepID=UPI0032F0676E